ncbi:uncharacterized protein LOC141691825 [Apium graveolens]|uniref:uncharacterized protein LOC141691825 n=1 Tax=Apium graveolens TaxID=4045 RepID=UPI003D7B91E7
MEALKVKYMASSYTIVNGRMYRRSVSQPLLRCLNVDEQQKALETVHDGICGENLNDYSQVRDPESLCLGQRNTVRWEQVPKVSASLRGSTNVQLAHPQGNGPIEAANKIIFQEIKKKLGEAKGRWAEELPWILWAYRTTPM